MRGKDYSVLDRPEVQSRLHLPADQQFSRSESGLVRQLYDCPDVAVGPEGVRCRVVVATHPAAQKKSRIGRTRKGVGDATLFHPSPARRVHRLRCGGTLRGLVVPLNQCLPMKIRSRARIAGVVMRPPGKKRGKSSESRIWNLRLELSHQLEPTPLRTTSFAPSVQEQATSSGYGKPTTATRLGKQVALREMPFPSSQTAPCAVQRARRSTRP